MGKKRRKYVEPLYVSDDMLRAKIKIAYEVLLEEDEDMSTEMLFARIEDMTGASLNQIIALLED